MQALLIGKRAKILTSVKDRLRAFGWQVILTDDLDLQKLLALDVSKMAVIAFGRAVNKNDKDVLLQHYKQQNGSVVVVDGLAPIPELIVYQILAAAHPITSQALADAKQ